MIDSALVSAQNRKRYYWTNIIGVEQPADRNIRLRDIMQPADQVDDYYWYDEEYTWHGDLQVCATIHMKNQKMHNRVHHPNHRVATLLKCQGGHTQKKVWQDGRIRKMTPIEYERAQTLPDNYTNHVARGHRYSLCGNGWTVEVIKHILKNI